MTRKTGLPIQHFDLTTAQGRKEAFTVTNIPSLLNLLAMPLLPMLLNAALDKGISLIKDVFNSPESIIEKQKEAAIDIINAGRDANVSSIEITLDQVLGVDFARNIKDADVKCVLGKSGKMTMKVAYK